ncbi:MAG: hypothetical protein S0880_08175 [Actinomycetota bacterium]|nr:hypothetical protein [Actinomycetota bacterium]
MSDRELSEETDDAAADELDDDAYDDGFEEGYDDGEDGRPREVSPGARRGVLAVIIAAALVSALFGFRAITADDGGDRSTSVADQEFVDTLQPTLSLYPQRARAGTPVRMVVTGTGCRANSSADLSVVELGSRRTVEDTGRLLLLRRVSVSPAGDWSARPLILSEQPAAYQVTISCPRFGLGGLDADEELQPGPVTVSDVLVLSGPAEMRRLAVVPEVAPSGAPVDVRVRGDGCEGEDPAVTGQLVGRADGDIVSTFAFAAPVGADGSWNATVRIPAAQASGTFFVDAVCTSGLTYPSESLFFVERGVVVVPTPGGPDGGSGGGSNGGSGSGVPDATPPDAIDGTPTYTG